MTTMSSSSTTDMQHDDNSYPTLRQQVSFPHGPGPIFTTSATDLWEVYLLNLPEQHRQHYNCHACMRFINTYGHLAMLDEKGNMRSAIWPDSVPYFFRSAVGNMLELIKASSITGVFLSEQKVWGTPVTGQWDHFYVQPAPVNIWNSKTKTAHQEMAEYLEDYQMLHRALAEYKQATIDLALTLLRSEALYRDEKVLGVAEWFHKLSAATHAERNIKRRNNLVWLAVATAPPGWCHVRSTMIGTLLDDIQGGMGFEAVSRRFQEKMNPTQYQRPQAAPTAGNIKRAEDLVKKLGIERSLERRSARLEECQLLWRPQQNKQQPARDGVFAHLRPQAAPSATMAIPNQSITWTKFQNTVLPQAEKIEFYVPSTRENYIGLVSAVHRDAPPILQWDSEGRRNPVSWYVSPGGSPPSRWNMTTGWRKVTGACLLPSMWNTPMEHHGKSAIFILEGAWDASAKQLMLFPEILKSDLREVSATIEAHSQSKRLASTTSGTANGIRLQAGIAWGYKFRVTIGNTTAEYTLDRWD